MKFDYIELRRHFHENPELSFQEYHTSEKISEILNALSIPCTSGIAKTGVMGILKGKFDGPTLLIRADMDALPILETNSCTYTSKNTGVMHACGHDVHVSTVLMAAELLSQRKQELKGTVKFLFQPAEETTGGALPMIQEGVLKNPDVNICVGFHVRPELETGKIICAEGKLMASPDNFYVLFNGKGGHCATPEQNDDLIKVAFEFIQKLKSIQYPDSIVTVCTVNAGDAPNVMPSEIRISGSFRTFDNLIREKIAADIKTVAKEVADTYKLRQQTDIELLYPPLKNDAALAKIMQKSAAKVIGEENIITEFKPSMLGEDFSYFGQYVPSVYFYLGSKIDSHPTSLHADNFDVDERCIELGAKAIEQFTLDVCK